MTLLQNQSYPSEAIPWSPVAKILVCALAAWLCFPIFYAQHVEGFSAQTQSLALLLAEGGLETHDLQMPIISQYIFMTRSGVIDLLAALITLNGPGDANFRLVTISAFITLVGASCAFARQWGASSLWPAFLALLLLPGIAFLSFYFNDNVVSASLAALALACLGRTPSPGRALAGGVALGLAVQCRLDALLAAPLFYGLLMMAAVPIADRLRLAALASVGLILILSLLGWWHGFSPLDSYLIAKNFMPGSGSLLGVRPLLYFFGPVSPILLVLGCSRSWRSLPMGDVLARLSAQAVFFVYPLMLLLYSLQVATGMRYFLPLLAPILALHGARGVEALIEELRQKALGAAAIVLTMVALLIAPPMAARLWDGPESFGGQIWSPVYWRNWQETQAIGLARVDRLIAATERPGRAAIITTHFNDDFYVRLRAMERGYRSVPGAVPSPCRGLSVYRTGSRQIVHVRLEPQYGRPFDNHATAALHLSVASHCPLVGEQAGAWLTTFGPFAVLRTGRPEFSQRLFEVSLTRPIGDLPGSWSIPWPGPRAQVAAVAWLPRAKLDPILQHAARQLRANRSRFGTEQQMLDYSDKVLAPFDAPRQAPRR